MLLFFPTFVSALRFQSTLPQLMTWCSSDPPNTPRQEFERYLSQGHTQHLVIVHYLPHHDVRNEWVYNSADIDHSTVVWARDMGPKKNLELIDYFLHRKVWIVEPDKSPPDLLPYRNSLLANPTSAAMMRAAKISNISNTKQGEP